MPAQVQFCMIETEDGACVGKLNIPNRKLADWINFLVSPRQQVRILLVEERRGGLTLYFQADERLYHYLHNRLNHAAEQPAADKVTIHEPLREAIAN